MDHRRKYKTQNYKLLEDNIVENLGDLGCGNTIWLQHQRPDL